MKRFPLLLVAAALVFPATADAKLKVCPSQSVYEATQVKDVTCAKAKSVLKDYFKDQVAPGAWDCKQKQYPGGVTTTCRKGDAKIVRQSAD